MKSHQDELPALPEPKATGLGPEYESFDRDGLPMGKAYANIDYFTADQMRTYARAALAAQPLPVQTEKSPTAGMSIAQRILHVGGRNNAAGYVEFGSTQAVEALVRQVLRDLPIAANPKAQPATDARFDWGEYRQITDLPTVDEAIRALLDDQTDENATCVVRAVVEATHERIAAMQEPVVSDEAARLRALISTPELHDFSRGVVLEAVHQRERWGSEHDAGKTPADWFWLVGYLAGKALHAQTSGNTDKALHHTISTAAALANWHAAITGSHTAMRPGIDAAPASPSSPGIESCVRGLRNVIADDTAAPGASA